MLRFEFPMKGPLPKKGGDVPCDRCDLPEREHVAHGDALYCPYVRVTPGRLQEDLDSATIQETLDSAGGEE